MAGKFLSGDEILKRRKQQYLNSQNGFDSGINILYSRGKPQPIDNGEEIQRQMEIIRQRRNEMVKRMAPSQTMSPLPKQSVSTIPSNTLPVQWDKSSNSFKFNSVVKPTTSINKSEPIIRPATFKEKLPFVASNVGDVLKEFTYGFGNSVGGKLVRNAFESDIQRTLKKRNGGRVPEGYSHVTDVDNYFADNYNILRKSGLNDNQINDLKKQKLNQAKLLDEQEAHQAFMDKNQNWTPSKAEQYAEMAGGVAGELGKMAGIGAIAGPMAGAISNPVLRKATERAITGAGVAATDTLNEGGDLLDFIKKAGRQTLFIEAGGAAGDVVGNLGGKILSNAPKYIIGNNVANALANIAVSTLKGAAFGAAGTAATIPTYSKNDANKPSWSNVLINAAVSALFEGLPTTVNAIRGKYNVKAGAYDLTPYEGEQGAYGNKAFNDLYKQDLIKNGYKEFKQDIWVRNTGNPEDYDIVFLNGRGKWEMKPLAGEAKSQPIEMPPQETAPAATEPTVVKPDVNVQTTKPIAEMPKVEVPTIVKPGIPHEQPKPVEDRPKPVQETNPIERPIADNQTSTVRVNVTDINVDPQRFQYKLDTNAKTGASKLLKNVSKWDENLAGRLTLWEDKNGRLWVVNGHHRLDLAKRLNVKSVDARILKESDGISAREAREIGARINIAEGRGTATDAAKLFRDGNYILNDLKESGLSLSEGTVKKGFNIAQLNDRLFMKVINKNITEDVASMIGEAFPKDGGKNDSLQNTIYDYIDSEGDVTKSDVEQAINMLKNSDSYQENGTQLSLLDNGNTIIFGDNFKYKKNIIKGVLRKLGSEKALFKNLVNSNKATIAEKAGNVLNATANEKGELIAERAIEFINRDAWKKGTQIGYIINKYANNIVAGGDTKINTQSAYNHIKEIIESGDFLTEGQKPESNVIEGQVDLFSNLGGGTGEKKRTVETGRTDNSGREPIQAEKAREAERPEPAAKPETKVELQDEATDIYNKAVVKQKKLNEINDTEKVSEPNIKNESTANNKPKVKVYERLSGSIVKISDEKDISVGDTTVRLPKVATVDGYKMYFTYTPWEKYGHKRVYVKANGKSEGWIDFSTKANHVNHAAGIAVDTMLSDFGQKLISISDNSNEQENANKLEKADTEINKENGFKEGDRVSFESKGKTLTGTIKNLDDYSDINPSFGKVADIDVDQVMTAGGVPIGRREMVPINNLKLIEKAVEPGTNTEPQSQENKPLTEGNKESQQIADNVKELLKSKHKFSSNELFKISDEVYKGTQAQGKYTPKDAYDAMELAVNQYIKENNIGDATVKQPSEVRRNIIKLQELLNLLPTETKRTVEAEQYQQFSTPPSIAYTAAWVANINKNDTVLEPSAGIGGLAVFAQKAGADVYVNELSKRRLDVLKNMGFKGYFNENAEQLDNILPDNIKPTVVIMNPPFSATAGRMGDKNNTKNAVNHIQQALNRLEPNGRLVAIAGRGMADNAPTFKEWWKGIKDKYNVRANISINGKNYTKYGTSFGIQLVVIDKTGPTKGKVLTGEITDLTEIPNLLGGIRNARPNINIKQNEAVDNVQKPTSEIEGETRQQPSLPVAGDNIGNTKTGVNSAGAERPSEQRGGESNSKPSVHNGKAIGGRTGGSIQTNDTTIRPKTNNRQSVNAKESGRSTVGTSAGSGEQSQREPSVKNVSEPRELNTEIKSEEEIERDRKKIEEDENAVYTTYVPKKLKIKGAHPHGTPLVESAAMAAVDPPDPTYKPHLPEEIITKGILSDAQLESVVYAGQAHEQVMEDGQRKGFFIGDGTGVGKGRQIAGIILDNWNQGRKKAAWITNSNNLYGDAIRDWTALGGNKDDVFELRKNNVHSRIDKKEGIMFLTYDTLKSGSKFIGAVESNGEELTRLNQVIKWLGKDFDGVIVFDEAHNMGNAIESGSGLSKKKPSEKARAGVELQKQLPNARIVYSSATGATDVHNLAYATRLGLWGEGTAFIDVNDFINKISSGGLAAMELVARDMKAMGVYIARNLSFKGVEYDTLQHDLNPMQVEIYNKMAEAWQIVLQHTAEALEATNQNLDGRRRAAAFSAFWSANQRFYNQIITSMAMPSVVADIKKELNNGNAVVLQIVNTNQAAADRQIAKAEKEGLDIDDMDLTPTDSLIQYIDKCFPVQQFETYIDDEGHTKSRPVQDSNGNPIINREMLKKKQKLISDIKEMKVPDGPLEILLDTFGVENVAEVTGRTRRVVIKKDEKTGKLKRVVEKRTPAMAEADAQAFQDGKKLILIFSDAGGTGKSYHADKNAKNQKRRVHYLLQAGWNAFKATQGIGRTHRSNEVVPPIFRIVTTNLMGQKRFISTIARRLDQMGALTKGQRQAGSGVFSEKDNLEGPLASDALEYFYRELFEGRIAGASDGIGILKKMGLYDKLVNENGSYREDPYISRDVPRFLNRILNLGLDEQNAVFDGFYSILEMAFNRALEAGTLDMGLENYKAEKVVVNDEKVIRKDSSGAETKYISMTAYKKPYIMSYSDVIHRDRFAGFVKIKGTGEIRAVYKGPNKTLSDGSVTETYKLLSPMYGKESNYIKKTYDAKTVRINKADWKSLWNEEISKQPKYREENLHLLTGTLLPIWDKLPQTNTRVLRIVDDKGNTYLGRLISADDIDDVLGRFDITRKKEEYAPKDLYDRVLKNGDVVRLENRMQLERRRVSGEYRIEIIGNNIWYYSKNIPGIITETINYQRRYFIPTDEEKATAIIGRLIENNPVIDVTTKMFENDSDEENFASTYNGPQIGKATGENTTGKAKRASEIVSEFADKLNMAVKRKHRGSTLGTFNNKTYIIRIKKANDIGVLSHETGHMLDRLYSLTLTKDKAIRDELKQLGLATSKRSYTPSKVRKEGIAEFTRLYMTDEEKARTEAPEVFRYFEAKIPKEVLDVLKGIRKDIWDLTNLDAVNRIRTSIHFKGDKKVKQPVDIMAALRKIYTGMVDMTYPAEYAAKEMAGEKARNKIANMLSKFRGYEGISLYDLFDAQTSLDGKEIGPSYQEILAPVLKNESIRKDFMTYQVARRAMDYFERGLELPDTRDTYEAAINELEAKYPEFNVLFDAVKKYRENNTHMLVDAGIYSEKDYQDMLENNANYVPMKRVIEAANKISGSGRALGGAKKVVKKVRGGGEDIIDPMESDINNTFIYRSVSIRNQILKQLADYADRAEGKGYIMSKSENKIRPTSFNLQQLEKALTDQGVDLTGIDLNTMIRIWNPNYLAGPNQVVVYRNGNPVLYDVNPEVYEAVKNMSPEAGNAIVKAMMTIANIQKTGIIFTSQHISYNTGKDTFHNLISSESGINPFDIVTGFLSAIDRDKYYKIAQSRGGTVNYFSANDRKFAQEAIDDMLAGQSMAKKLWSKARHPFRTIQDFIEPSEMGGRIAELKKHLKKMGNSDAEIEQAITDMRRLSIDFKRMGSWVKKLQLNRITNFFNSNIQGLDNVIRLLYKHPIRTVLRSLLYLTIPTLFLMVVNKDNEYYRQLPWYRKDFFFLIPVGDPKNTTRFIRIPVPWELGLLFKALPERIVWKLYDDDPHAFDEFMDSVKQTIMPETMPSALQPIYEDAVGLTWNGKPILSESDKRVSPELQYNEYTSETSKAIANITKNIPLPDSLKSPKRLEHLIEGYTGTLGSMALEDIDIALGKKEGTPVIDSFTNAFITDAYRSPQSVNDFYKNKKVLDKEYSDAKRLRQKMNEKSEALRQIYNKVEDEISVSNDLKHAVDKSKKLSESEKQLKITAINTRIIELSSKANALYDRKHD